MTPLRAIRLHCLKCMGWDSGSSKPVKAVRECRHGDCSLHPYRYGKDPGRQNNTGNAKWRKQAVDAILF